MVKNLLVKNLKNKEKLPLPLEGSCNFIYFSKGKIKKN